MADHARVPGAGEVAVVLIDAELQTLAVHLERKYYNISSLLNVDFLSNT